MQKNDGRPEDRLTLALIAHDSRKEEMVALVTQHQGRLNKFGLVATRNTGQLVQSRTGLVPTLVNRDHMGGDQQIGALVASGVVNAVIFLRDPLTAQSYEPEVTALMRICDVCNVPLATNLATAEAILFMMFEHPEVLMDHQFEAKLNNELLSEFDK